MSVSYQANPVSDGMGIGKICVLEDAKNPVKVSADSSTELLRFQEAVKTASKTLEEEYERQVKRVGADEAEILQAHLLMLQDPDFLDDVSSRIQSELCNADYAVLEASNAMAELFLAMDNDYFKERAQDIKDVARRIIDILMGRELVDLAGIEEPTILLARELLPSQTILLRKEFTMGIATLMGGKTSHTAIIAKTMGIPLISGIDATLLDTKWNGHEAILSADEGLFILDPDEATVSDYRERIKKVEEEEALFARMRGCSTKTKNGKCLELVCNIGMPKDATLALEHDAEGVGLFRSEFLYMDRDSAPTEEEQYEAYVQVLETMGDKPVIIRTMDIGGDKQIPYLSIPFEANPFLGLRAIRYCLRDTELFRVQIRALLRAACKGNLKIMLPMISSVAELRVAKDIIEEVKEALKSEGVPFKSDVPLGIMIEIPSAAIQSDLLAKECDFFSIGTNDLIQYTTAVDRMNETISDLYSYYHPSVLRLINMTIQNSHKAGITTGMCGDMASDRLLAPLLAAMGLDEFSVTPIKVLQLRARLLNSEADAKDFVDAILSLSTAEEVEEALREFSKTL